MQLSTLIYVGSIVYYLKKISALLLSSRQVLGQINCYSKHYWKRRPASYWGHIIKFKMMTLKYILNCI